MLSQLSFIVQDRLASGTSRYAAASKHFNDSNSLSPATIAVIVIAVLVVIIFFLYIAYSAHKAKQRYEPKKNRKTPARK